MITLTLRLSSANVCFDFTPGLQVRWITWKWRTLSKVMVVIVVAVVMVTLTKPPCHLLIDLRLVRSHCVTTLNQT